MVGVLFLLLALSAARHTVDDHLRAMSLLMRFSDPQAQGFSARFAQGAFTQELTTVQTPSGPLKFRLYIPQGVSHPPAVIVLHGIHNLGLEEPRLVHFASAAAGAGVLAMTPELTDIADYQVTPHTVDVIGDAATVLSQRTGHKVGVIGLSFAGGLALLAASRPQYAEHISFVVAVGAHDDMGRVARFFAANIVEHTDGSKAPFSAHEYGALVLIYTHLGDFFQTEDIPAAREALKFWLWEKPDDSLRAARQMSAAGQAEFDLIIHHHEQLQHQLLDEVTKYSEAMAAVSPHGKLDGLKVPVFLLHGTADSVIPASESEWLAKDVPPADLRRLLLSPALIHVHLEDKVPFSQKWDLIDFMAQVLQSARQENQS
jgi:pimeloyl-ACP methyl ester carboxylesterase